MSAVLSARMLSGAMSGALWGSGRHCVVQRKLSNSSIACGQDHVLDWTFLGQGHNIRPAASTGMQAPLHSFKTGAAQSKGGVGVQGRLTVWPILSLTEDWKDLSACMLSDWLRPPTVIALATTPAHCSVPCVATGRSTLSATADTARRARVARHLQHSTEGIRPALAPLSTDNGAVQPLESAPQPLSSCAAVYMRTASL